MNRLRWEWKKDPWHPGQTIDLGGFEDRFQRESGIASLPAGTRIAPAVLDWLRWRYRRFQIDRKRDADWLRVLREDYPRRVRGAGPPPVDEDTGAQVVESPAALWKVGPLGVTSKRQRLDVPSVVAERKPRALREQRIMPGAMGQNDLALMAAKQHATLAPLLAKCRGEGERRSLILALHDYLAAPEDGAAGKRWRDFVTELWAR